MTGPEENSDSAGTLPQTSGEDAGSHGLIPRPHRDRVPNRRVALIVLLTSLSLLVACVGGGTLSVVLGIGSRESVHTASSLSSASTTTPTITVLPTESPISTATPSPSPRQPTPTSPPSPPPQPTATPTPSNPWYQAPWRAKCNCSRGNIQLTSQVPTWTAGRQYYVFVTTTPGSHIQFRMTAPNGVVTENNWAQSVADPAGNWSIQVTAPSGPGFALLQARTDKGAYADTSVACLNN